MLCELIDESAVPDPMGYSLVRVARLTMDDGQVYKVRMTINYNTYEIQSYARVEVLNRHLEWTCLMTEPTHSWHRRVKHNAVTSESIIRELGSISNDLSLRAGNILR